MWVVPVSLIPHCQFLDRGHQGLRDELPTVYSEFGAGFWVIVFCILLVRGTAKITANSLSDAKTPQYLPDATRLLSSPILRHIDHFPSLQPIRSPDLIPLSAHDLLCHVHHLYRLLILD